MTHARSPLAPASFPELPPVAGVMLAVAESGTRYKNRPDLLLVSLAGESSAAGVLTRSRTASAPVLACRERLKSGGARALAVNAGNSNAFTGRAGEEAVAAISQAAAKALGCGAEEVFVASTGVIGEPLPHLRLTAHFPAMAGALSENAWEPAARAIMTTDTFPKAATRRCEIGGKTITINGIAKGSGMIAPDMATLLAFVFTDAKLPAAVLQSLLNEAAEASFNRITVDGDTSTSDTLLLFATGKAGNAPVSASSAPEIQAFREALISLCVELAQLVVRDGEGARKFVSITVSGAESEGAARRIALSVANSPLVKTALAAGDANWGRIVAAVGKAGERAERDRLRIEIGGVCVARDGAVAPDYRETMIDAHMKGDSIDIRVDVGVGDAASQVWTCDLTHGYIDINGSYRS